MAKRRQSNDVELLQRMRRLAITGIFSDDRLLDKLVLKGGNLLDVVYGISARTSVDVDLSMDGEFEGSLEDLSERIERGLKSTFSDAGYTVFDLNIRSVPPHLSDDMKCFWGGYKIDFKIIHTEQFAMLSNDIEALRRNSISVGKRGSTRFTVDISKHEYCQAKEAADVDGYTIFTYTPPMFVCEKLRAICQQMSEYVALVKSNPSARSRDFVDIQIVTKGFAIDFSGTELKELLNKTFEVKRVPLELIGAIQGTREFHSADFVSVQDTVKAGTKLKSFDFYFDFVCARCEELESFWDE